MATFVSDLQLISLLTCIGFFLGMLGSLSLAYDFLDRKSKVLQKCIWVLSSGFVIGLILFASYLFFFGSERLVAGYSTSEIGRFAGVLGMFGFIFQFAFPFPLPQARPPIFLWSNALWPVIFTGILLCSGGVGFSATHNPVVAVIFALPSILVIGLLNGFSAAIQWWFLHLPEKRVAFIGAMLIFCAFALASVQPLLNLLGIPSQ